MEVELKQKPKRVLSEITSPPSPFARHEARGRLLFIRPEKERLVKEALRTEIREAV